LELAFWQCLYDILAWIALKLKGILWHRVLTAKRRRTVNAILGERSWVLGQREHQNARIRERYEFAAIPQRDRYAEGIAVPAPMIARAPFRLSPKSRVNWG
jgi:hypothetical protein